MSQLTVSVAFAQPRLKLFFDDFPSTLFFNSWNLLMWQMGLRDNETPAARALAPGMHGALYETLVTWLYKMKQGVSINTLLERIQDHVVGSRKCIYEEGRTGSAVS